MLRNGLDDFLGQTTAKVRMLADWLSRVKSEFSKDLDKNGEPLIVYHATHADNLKEFKKSHIGENTGDGFLGRAFYFSSLVWQLQLSIEVG